MFYSKFLYESSSYLPFPSLFITAKIPSSVACNLWVNQTYQNLEILLVDDLGNDNNYAFGRRFLFSEKSSFKF